MSGFLQLGTAYVRADAIVAIASNGTGGSLVYVPGNIYPSETPPAALTAQVAQLLDPTVDVEPEDPAPEPETVA